MDPTELQLLQLRGQYWIKCVKVGGHTLINYGQRVFAENEELDLLADTTPATLRAADFGTAGNLCEDPSLEIAQLIAAGDFVVSKVVRPDPNVGISDV